MIGQNTAKCDMRVLRVLVTFETLIIEKLNS